MNSHVYIEIDRKEVSWLDSSPTFSTSISTNFGDVTYKRYIYRTKCRGMTCQRDEKDCLLVDIPPDEVLKCHGTICPNPHTLELRFIFLVSHEMQDMRYRYF